MIERSLNVYFSSNRKGRTYRFELSIAALKLSICLISIFSILFVGILFDYTGLLYKKSEFNTTKTLNLEMKDRILLVESQLNTLEENLLKIKAVSNKVELITSIADEAVISKLSEAKPLSVEAGLRVSQALGSIDLKPAFLLHDEPFEDEVPEVRRSIRDIVVKTPLADRIELAATDTLVMEQKVLSLFETLSERQNFLRAIPSIKPSNGWYTSRFGYRIDPFTHRPTMHNGLDIAARIGTPVLATADGVISHSGVKSGYGNLVIIDHGYGVETRYGHNSRLYVKVGQAVARGEKIAAVGNTGRSTNPHCHYEVRVRGVPVDPMNYVLDFE